MGLMSSSPKYIPGLPWPADFTYLHNAIYKLTLNVVASLPSSLVLHPSPQKLKGGCQLCYEHIINGFTLRLVLADMLQKGLRFITHPEVRIGVPLFFYVGPTTSAVGAIRCCDGKKNTWNKNRLVLQFSSNTHTNNLKTYTESSM